MKLNTQYKVDLRNYVVGQIQGLCQKGEFPEGTKIKLDTNLLEELLFEVKKDVTGQEYKVIVWDMPGLDKIDLSEISFDDVDWKVDHLFDLSNSNASINFESAYKGKNGIAVSNVNFENVSLAEANANAIDSAHKCSFKGTNIELAPFTPTSKKRFTYCDFTGENLKGSILSSFQVLAGEVGDSVDCFKGSTFIDTGINVDVADIKEHQELISAMIREGRLRECFVNGILIPSKERAQENANAVLAEYQAYVDIYREGIEKAMDEIKLSKKNKGKK